MQATPSQPTELEKILDKCSHEDLIRFRTHYRRSIKDAEERVKSNPTDSHYTWTQAQKRVQWFQCLVIVHDELVRRAYVRREQRVRDSKKPSPSKSTS